MQDHELEQCLNEVIQEMFTGLNDVAAKVRDGASADDTADSIKAMARIICDHWPDCLMNNPHTESSSKKECSQEAS